MNKKNILAITLLLLFFIVPILAAFWLFQHPQRLALKTVNHGQLLQPLLDVKNLPLQALTQQTPTWPGHWIILYLNPQPTCAQACQQILYNLRQVRLALGKNQDRVIRAYLEIGHTPDSTTQKLLTGLFNGTQAFSVSHLALMAFLPKTYQPETLQTGQLWIVDPDGHAMMRYSATFSAKDLLADLNRLLMVN